MSKLYDKLRNNSYGIIDSVQSCATGSTFVVVSRLRGWHGRLVRDAVGGCCVFDSRPWGDR